MITVNNKHNKRGVSEVVSLVLLIMISIVLAAIVFIYVMNYADKPLQFSPNECLDIQSNPPISIISACYNKLTKNIEARLSRSADEHDINSMSMAITSSDSGRTKLFSCSNSCGSCRILESGSTRIYYLPSSSQPDGLSLIIGDCGEVQLVKKVEVC